MSEGKRDGKVLLLDEESWNLWYELENLEAHVDSWCCRVIKEGNFEEAILNKMDELFGAGIIPLNVNFCLHCGGPLKQGKDIRINYRECCCQFTSLIGFVEFYEPKTGIIHRMKENFCFNCGRIIKPKSA